MLEDVKYLRHLIGIPYLSLSSIINLLYLPFSKEFSKIVYYSLKILLTIYEELCGTSFSKALRLGFTRLPYNNNTHTP